MMNGDATWPLNKPENGPSQSDASRLLTVKLEDVDKPARNGITSMQYGERLERSWLAIKRSGEYVQPIDDGSQGRLDEYGGGAA